MNPVSIVAPLGVAMLLAAASPAFAVAVIRDHDVVARTAMAEAVVIGKVTDIQKGKNGWMVATITVESGSGETKGLKQVRVGFPEPPVLPPTNPPLLIKQPPQAAIPTKDQEAAFFLFRHATEDYYVFQLRFAPIPKAFEFEMKPLKRTLAVLEDPVKALKAKEAEDRQFAAGVLLEKYRTYRQGPDGRNPKLEDVPAEDSKLILQAMSEMTFPTLEQFTFNPMGLNYLWISLGLTATDGWNPPVLKNNAEYAAKMTASVRDWIKKHGETYRIRRYVFEKPKT